MFEPDVPTATAFGRVGGDAGEVEDTRVVHRTESTNRAATKAERRAARVAVGAYRSLPASGSPSAC